MKNKRWLIITGIFLIVGIAVASLFTNSNKSTSAVKSGIPECYAGRCPQYFSMDVDGDNSSSESVVVVPTAMTQGAGKVIVIKKGKVIFESPELMRINAIQTKKQLESGSGFTILYGKEVNSNVGSEISYKYQNGKVTIDATSK